MKWKSKGKKSMNYQANENDIASTIKDFEALCKYIMTNKPLLTEKGDLCTKACFDVNGLMTYPEAEAKKTDRMNKYPSVSLYFMIAMSTGLLEQCLGARQKNAVTVSEAYMTFGQMNSYSKYLFIFLAWMRYIDTEELYQSDILRSMYGSSIIDHAFEQIGLIDEPMIINRDEASLIFALSNDAIQTLMNCRPTIICNFRNFGVIAYNNMDIAKSNMFKSVVNKIYITEFGIKLSSACATRRFTWVNVMENLGTLLSNDVDKEIEIYENDFKQNLPGSLGFLKPFLSCFPENEIDCDTINQLIFPNCGIDSLSDKTIYEFRVQINRGCYRVIQCSSRHTFEDLHLAIQEAFAFDNDHLYAFYMDGKKGSRRAINSPYSEEAPFADEICIGQVGFRVKQTVLYLFDFGDEWMFQVTLISIHENNSILLDPLIVKSIGDPPEQYPDFDEDGDYEFDF